LSPNLTNYANYGRILQRQAALPFFKKADFAAFNSFNSLNCGQTTIIATQLLA
jgi:hypothetical protein